MSMQAPFVDPLLFIQDSPPQLLPLVGRQRELSLLRLVLETVRNDAPAGARAITISGEIGIGKTRLLAQLCREARQRNMRVLEARAYEASRILPYFPFIEALRPTIHTLPNEHLRHLLGLQPQAPDFPAATPTALSGNTLLGALAHLFPTLPTQVARQPQTEFVTPEQEKFRIFEAVATLLERLASEQPLLLAIDNLQWADSASQELTLYLTVRLHSSRVLLIGVTRPPSSPSVAKERAQGFEEKEGEDMVNIASTPSAHAIENTRKILLDLMQQGLLGILPLGPLASDEASEHLHTLLPGTIPQPISEALLTRAEGNPFFLEELVRTLTIQRRLVLQQNTWNLVQEISTQLPDSIMLAVRQRLQELSPTCRDLLATASLFGRVFPSQALLLVAGEEAHAGLEEAEQAQLISQLPEPSEEDGYDQQVEHQSGHALHETLFQPARSRYAFCQGIVHEVLQATISTHRLRGLHYRIAQALESYYAYEARSHAAELAIHYAKSGEKAATLHWSLLAGEEATRQQSYREAINHLRLVIKLVEAGQIISSNSTSTTATPTLAQLYLTVGELWFKLGELEQASASLQHALEETRKHDATSPLLLARINRILADIYRMQAKYEQAMSHLQMARFALDQEAQYGQQESLALTARATLPWFARSGLATNVGTATIEHITSSERIQLLQAQAILDIFYNRSREAEQAFWQSHELAIQLGDRSSQAFVLHMVGWLRGWSEHIHESLRLQKQANELYIALGDPFRAALGDQGIGIIYLALGEIALANDYTQRGFERARRYGIRRMLGLLHWNEGMIALTQGNWSSCEAQLQQAMQEATTNDDARLKPLVLLAQAECYFRHGQWQEAEQIFQDAIQAGASTEWAPGTLALYGHFLAVTGRRNAAHSYLERVSTQPERIGIAGSFYIPFLAEGYLHLGSIEHALPYIERIKLLRGFLYFGISVDRILGELATLNKDWQAAEQAFEDGLRLCRRANNQTEEAAILYEQARMAITRGDALPSIEQLCTQARHIFQQYDMQRSSDLVDTLLEGMRTLKATAEKPSRPAQAPSIQRKATASDHVLHLSLSAREREVLQLVAEGNTDREVADILVLSPRTVNRHLSNIFVKLDVPGRASAVAYAIRNGLV